MKNILKKLSGFRKKGINVLYLETSGDTCKGNDNGIYWAFSNMFQALLGALYISHCPESLQHFDEMVL